MESRVNGYLTIEESGAPVWSNTVKRGYYVYLNNVMLQVLRNVVWVLTNKYYETYDTNNTCK